MQNAAADEKTLSQLDPYFLFVRDSAEICNLLPLSHMSAVFENILKEDDDAAAIHMRRLQKLQHEQKSSPDFHVSTLSEKTMHYFSEIFLSSMQRMLEERKELAKLRRSSENETWKQAIDVGTVEVKPMGGTPFEIFEDSEHNVTHDDDAEFDQLIRESEAVIAWSDEVMGHPAKKPKIEMTAPLTLSTILYPTAGATVHPPSPLHCPIERTKYLGPGTSSKRSYDEKRTYNAQLLQSSGLELPPCPLCDYSTFKNTRAVVYHFKKHHSDKSFHFVCNFCDAKIRGCDAANRHIVEVCEGAAVSIEVSIDVEGEEIRSPDFD